jgi:hypothetical protein
MPYEKEMVLYGIVSNLSSNQPIRVYTTYDSDALVVGEPGPDTRLRDAVVTVTDVSVVGAQSDTCRFSDQVECHLWSPAALRRGHEYRLLVTAAGMGAACAEVEVPGDALVTPGSLLTLREPSSFTSDFTVSTRLAPQAKAYVVRLLVEYEFFASGVWVPGRIEVPKEIRLDAASGGVQSVYPNLIKRLGSEEAGYTDYQIMAFDHDAYLWTLDQVRSRYAIQGLKFRRAVVHLTQVDVHLYNYYNIANGFHDPYTMRTDEPDYTNVDGGRGIFGAAVVDSVIVSLPEVVR